MVSYFLHNVVPNERKLSLTHGKTLPPHHKVVSTRNFLYQVKHLHITCGSPQMEILITIFKNSFENVFSNILFWRTNVHLGIQNVFNVFSMFKKKNLYTMLYFKLFFIFI